MAWEEALRAAEAARLRAMTSHDLGALSALLCDELTYTHGSGRSEGRDAYLRSLSGGTVRYRTAEPGAMVATRHGDTAWLHGRLAMTLERDAIERRFDVTFQSIWTAGSDGAWRMAAWIGTPFRQG